MIGSSDDIDSAILAVCTHRFQKVAMVIVRAFQEKGLYAAHAQENDFDRVSQQVESLVTTGRLECIGDVRNARHSEVRLPQQPTWFFADHGDACTIVRFCSADGINRLRISAIIEFGKILESLARDPRPLIITGNDNFFSVGADLNEMAAHDSVGGYRFSRLGQGVMDQIDQFPALTIAAISGNCFGGAIDMALACDLRICASNAVFGHRGAALGLITGWGGTQRLPRLIGKARALQMFCAAERLDAKEALRIGLVNEIAADPVATAKEKLRKLESSGFNSLF